MSVDAFQALYPTTINMTMTATAAKGHLIHLLCHVGLASADMVTYVCTEDGACIADGDDEDSVEVMCANCPLLDSLRAPEQLNLASQLIKRQYHQGKSDMPKHLAASRTPHCHQNSFL
jgi:hypothetical protein